MASIWQGWAIVWVAMVFALAAAWTVARARRDAGIVDVVWSAGVGAATLFMATRVAGYGPRVALVAAMAAIWSLRLAAYIYWDRIRPGREDGRYQALRARWGARADLYFLVFFESQSFLVVLFAAPITIAMAQPHPGWRAWDLVGLLLWLAAVAGESAADRQLARFRADPARRGQTCAVGLWRYSRHPNYFFEWLHWWAYVAIGVGGPGWPITWLGPAVMLLFLFRVTGIPATEARALASRGESYRRYQETTSAFIPWSPRRRDRS